MDYATLKSLKPSDFEDAADGYRSTGDMASQAKDRVSNQISSRMRDSLEGEALEAAVEQLGELSKNFHYTQIECGLISTALNALAAELRVAKKRLAAAVADAQGENFTVRADGSVSYPAAGEKTDGKTPAGGTATATTGSSDTARAIQEQAVAIDPNPNYGRAQEYAQRIAEAIKEATEADEKWAPKLRKLKADDDLTVSYEDWADAQKDMHAVRKGAEDYLGDIRKPPNDGSPEDNAKWWKGLSEQERSDYVSMHPASVGALDGLPSDIRDEANRAVLVEKRGQHETELAAIPPEPKKYTRNPNGSYPAVVETEHWKEWNEKHGERKEQLEKYMKGMRSIQDRFDRSGVEGLPEAYLLGFDLEGKGDGKIILANSNPDTADHTAVYVPGTFSGLESIGDEDIARGERLWAESDRFSPNSEISTITWLDYDAPDSIVPEASRGQYAEEGGPTLRQFLEGNKTAHEQATGGTAHTTVIGHSYGSTLVGAAAQSGSWKDGPMAADDILVAGSPGMQADRAVDLGIHPKHMWAMGGPWDDQIVRQGGRAMGLGDGWTIPTDESFGGNIMKNNSDGHSGFWDDESLGLRNQAAVITGRYNRVELE